MPRPKSYAESQSGRCARRSSAEPAGSYGSPAAMGSSQSVEIPGGGTEGYHVLRVRAAGVEAWGTAGAARPESAERPGRGCGRRGRGPATLAPGPPHGLAAPRPELRVAKGRGHRLQKEPEPVPLFPGRVTEPRAKERCHDRCRSISAIPGCLERPPGQEKENEWLGLDLTDLNLLDF